MGFTLTQSVSPKPFTCTTLVWTNVVQFLISKGTFGSSHFQKQIKPGLV
jgi:hypothetical protein